MPSTHDFQLPHPAPRSRCRTSYGGEPVQHFTLGEQYDYTIHEALPEIPSTHPSFKEAHDLMVAVLDKINNLFPTGIIADKQVEVRRDELAALRHVQHEEPIRGALVGDAGTGKSSLLNALVGQAVASAGDSGCSCTQVVTEFHDAGPLSVGCTATITFKSESTMKDEVNKHFRAYMKYMPREKDKHGRPIRRRVPDKIAELAENSDGDESNNDDQSDSSAESEDDTVPLNADGNDAERLASRRENFKTAEEYLMQVFSAVLKLNDQEDLKRLMATYRPASYAEKIARLQRGLLHIIKSPLPGVNGTPGRPVSIRKTSLGELMSMVRVFTDTQPPGCQAFWPVVQRVKIQFSSPLLRQGLILADCPGLSDTNITRRSATIDYLDSCKVILVVAAVDRILDAPNVGLLLDKYIPQVGVANVILVPTKCDVAKQNPTTRGVTKQECRDLEQIEAVLGKEKREWKNFRGSRDQKADLKKRWQNTQRLLLQMRIRTRNQAIEKEAQRQHRDERKETGDDLVVIPVASAIHELWMAGDTEDEEPILSVHDDGVARIRSLLCTVARRKHMKDMKHHVKSKMMNAINRLNLVLDATLNADMGAVFAQVDKFIKLSTSHIIKYRNTMQNTVKQTVLLPFCAELDAQDGRVATKIDDLVIGWKDSYPYSMTFRAFANKNGVHKPCKQESVSDLNQEIVATFKQPLADRTGSLRPALHALEDQMVADGVKLLNQLLQLLQDSTVLQPFDMTTFWDNTEISKLNHGPDIAQDLDTFADKIHNTGMNAVSGRSSTSFNQAMFDNYQSARKLTISENGKTIIRWSHVRQNMHDGPLTKLQTELRDVWAKATSDHTPDLRKALRKPFEEIRDDLRLRFGEGGSGKTMNVALRAQMKDALAAIIAELRDDLARASQYLDEAKWLPPVPREDEVAAGIQDGPHKQPASGGGGEVKQES